MASRHNIGATDVISNINTHKHTHKHTHARTHARTTTHSLSLSLSLSIYIYIHTYTCIYIYRVFEWEFSLTLYTRQTTDCLCIFYQGSPGIFDGRRACRSPWDGPIKPIYNWTVPLAVTPCLSNLPSSMLTSDDRWAGAQSGAMEGQHDVLDMPHI